MADFLHIHDTRTSWDMDIQGVSEVTPKLWNDLLGNNKRQKGETSGMSFLSGSSKQMASQQTT